MSASLLRPIHTASAQVLAVWRAMPGAFLLLGRAAGPLPKSGSARLAREAGTPGLFRTFFWPSGTEQAVGFLTVIRVPDRLAMGDEPEIVLRGARGGDRDFSLRLTRLCDEEEFGRQLALLAGTSAASVARFVLDLMQPEAEVDVRRPALLLRSFLQHAARHEGCVELLLEIPNRVLLLQGWGPPTGPDVEIILGANFARHPAQVGEFARNDVQAPLTGSVLALPVELSGEFLSMDAIFMLTESDVLCRRIIDARVLDPVSSTGQIRHLLPRLVCPPALAATLQLALRPQYEGVDTLNKSDRGVRAALDIAVMAAGAGIFISGWMFDPGAQVTKVECCAGERSVRVDPDFVRIQRDDVLLAFKDHPTLPASPRSDIGFAVSVDFGGAVPTNSHLRLTFENGDLAFLPLGLCDATEPGTRARLCSSVDMHKPSGLAIIERHLAPFLSRAPAPALPTSRVVLRGPLQRPHAVIVPLASQTLPRATIADLLRDPLTDEEQIIFVCGPEWKDARIEAMIEMLQFYDVPATVMTMTGRAGPLDAVLTAAELAEAETWTVMAPSACARAAGSRQALRLAAADAEVVCPTILYEDGSIRFAGSTKLDFADRAPFTHVRSRWLGLSGAHIEAAEMTDAIGGTLEYCLLRPDALIAVEQARRLTTKAGQEAALFAQVQQLGLRNVWLPAIVVASADDAVAEPTADALVDNWALRASWGDTQCAS